MELVIWGIIKLFFLLMGILFYVGGDFFIVGVVYC